MLHRIVHYDILRTYIYIHIHVYRHIIYTYSRYFVDIYRHLEKLTFAWNILQCCPSLPGDVWSLDPPCIQILCIKLRTRIGLGVSSNLRVSWAEVVNIMLMLGLISSIAFAIYTAPFGRVDFSKNGRTIERGGMEVAEASVTLSHD